jgi:hypothetical protein
LAIYLAACPVARGQVPYPNQEVRVSRLPKLVARSSDPSDVLLTSLDMIIHNRQICCGKDSALGDSAQRTDPSSLKDIAAKLQGRHLLGDGRPIMVSAEFVPAEAVNSGQVINRLKEKRAPLMMWDAHLYVVYGVIFDRTLDQVNGSVTDALHKFLLVDPRFSDSRRQVVFNRETDDWNKVQGILWLSVTPQ